MARKSWLSLFAPAGGVRIAVLSSLCLVTLSSHAWAQLAPPRRARIMRAPMVMPGRFFPGMPMGSPVAAGAADSAIPKIDPESQQLLKRADQFIADERYDLAAILWQKVLDEAGDNMVGVEGDRYVPLRSEVEAAISKAKPEAVAAYRSNADNEVIGMLARVTPENESEILGQVVRRFFLSEQGDDAAYRIGCRALDRGDFVLATRMFLKVLDEHPDPSISKGDLQLRLAVAAGKLGDKVSADEFLGLVSNPGSAGPSRSLIGLVTRDLAKKTSASVTDTQNDFPIAWGGSARRGAMQGLPPETYEATLTDRGFFEYPLQFPEQQPNMGYGYPVMHNPAAMSAVVARPQLMDRWKTAGWRPAGTVLIQDGRIYLKTSEDLVCFANAKSLSKPTWRTAWLNSFQVDDQSAQSISMRGIYNNAAAGRSDTPSTTAEVLLFGDRVHQSMAIVDDLLLTIEGVRRGRGSEPMVIPGRQVSYNQAAARRSRTNWLAAYDSKSGKVRWRRNADDEREEKASDPAPATDTTAEKPADATKGSEPVPVPVPPTPPLPVPVATAGFGPEAAGSSCFLASPVACGNLLLVPVSDGGTIFLMAISPADGKTRWRAQLCDDPMSGASPWSPIGVSVDGQEAYVVAGTGLVFAVDGTTGDIRWASRYRREATSASGTANPWQHNLVQRQFNGWEDDIAIPMGRQVVIMATDSDRMFALDRRTGKFMWDTPRVSPFGVEANYYLGTQANRLVVAGAKVVRGYDVYSGRLVWEREIEASCGRGCIAGDTVFVPSKDSILAYDLATGTERSHVGVSLATNSGEYVGNLYSDGEQLWMLNANRLYALTSLAARLEGLKTRIESGDNAAIAERTRLLARSGDWEGANQDLRQLYQRFVGDEGTEEALIQVALLMADVEMPSKQPSMAIAFIAEVAKDPSTLAALQNPDVANGVSAVITGAMRRLDPEKDSNVAESLLVASSPYWSSAGMRSQLARTLGALCVEAIPHWLEDLSAKPDADARRLAISIASQTRNKMGSGLLNKLLADSDPRIRYEAARGLLHIADRSALPELVKLLESDDVALRLSAARTLRGVTRSVLPFDASASGDKATEQLDAWKKWLQDDSQTASLKLPYSHDPLMIGRTVVLNAQSHQIVELDEYGKEIKRLDAEWPTTAWASPTGSKFVGLNQLGIVREYDENWESKWQSDPLPSAATSIHQGEDGVLVIACADARQVVQLEKNKPPKVLYQSAPQHRPICVRRLDGGNTLICLQNAKKVVEVDSSGKLVTEFKVEGSDVMSAFRGDDGTTSVLVQGNVLLEFDTKGVVSKTIKFPHNRVAQSVQPLPSGNYLIADGQGAKELDSQGKVVWTFNEQNAHFALRY